MTYPILTDAPITEDPRTQLRRRLQQKRCLVCGARITSRANYFCPTHHAAYRFCSACESARPTSEHGRNWRCRPCNQAKALTEYYRNPDRLNYRRTLCDMAGRRETEADQLFRRMRAQIALAAFVAQTPGWTWERRAVVMGGGAANLATRWRRQTGRSAR